MVKKRFFSLTRHLIIGSIAIWAVIIAVVLIIQYIQITNQVAFVMGNRLMSMAKVIAPFIDGDLHNQIQTKDDIDTEAYQKLLKNIRQVAQSHTDEVGGFMIKHDLIYTVRKNEAGEFVFVVIDKSPAVFDVYPQHTNDSHIPKLMNKAWEGTPTFTDTLYRDTNGYWLSAYAPFYDNKGKVAGLLELDFDAQQYYRELMFQLLYYFLEFFAIAVVITLLTSLIIRYYLRPAKKLNNICKQLAAGDFTHTAKKIREDEVGQLTNSVNTIKEELTKILWDILDYSDEINERGVDINQEITGITSTLQQVLDKVSSVEEFNNKGMTQLEQLNEAIQKVQSTMKRIEENVGKEVNTIQSFVSAIEQMVASIKNVSETTSRANELTQMLNQNAQMGSGSVHTVEMSINEIQESSNKITDIITIIQSIAKNTNLLSMNAAIEAAHAGESGRGFAVVADEVGKLAHSTTEASNDVIKLIKEMQEKVTNSVDLSQDAMDALQNITEDTMKVATIVDEVTDAMKEQEAMATDMSKSTLDLKGVSDATQDSVNDQRDVYSMLQQVASQFNAIIRESIDALEIQNKMIADIHGSINKLKDMSDTNVQVMEQIKTKNDRFRLPPKANASSEDEQAISEQLALYEEK